MEFTLSTIKLINVLFCVFGIGICGLCSMYMIYSVHLKKDVRAYFIVFFLQILLYVSAHLARELLEGFPGEGVRTALYIITFFEVLVAGIMSHMMSLLVLAIAKRESPQNTLKKWVLFLYVFLLAHIILLIVGWPLNLFYSYDGNNIYSREPLYLISNLCPILMMFVDVYLLIRYRKQFKLGVAIAFWLFILTPFVAASVQGFLYGLQLIIFATIISAVFMFWVVMNNLNTQYQGQQKENSRIEAELSMASSIQADMLPNIYPAFPERTEFDIYASMDPAKEVGGDFYDFFLVDEDHLCLVIADVSGKGVPAALFMMVSKIIISMNAMNGKSPAQILKDTNNAICSNNREGMFVTTWVGILEISTGKLVAANAGHENPLLCEPNGKFQEIKNKHGLIVGGYENTEYKNFEIQMKPGSKLFLYTDGIPEATNAEGERFGINRFLNTLNADTSGSPKELTERVARGVDSFVKLAEQFDDLTMLCVEYRGKQ